MRHARIFALSAVMLMVCLSCFAAVGYTDGGSDEVETKTVKQLLDLGEGNNYWASVRMEGTTYVISNSAEGDEPCIVDAAGYDVAFDTEGLVIPEGSGFTSNDAKSNLTIQDDVTVKGTFGGKYATASITGRMFIDGGTVAMASDSVLHFNNIGNEVHVYNGGKISFLHVHFNSSEYYFRDITNDTSSNGTFSMTTPDAATFDGTAVGTSADSSISIEGGASDLIIFKGVDFRNEFKIWLNKCQGKLVIDRDLNLLDRDALFVFSKDGIEGHIATLGEMNSIVMKYAVYDETKKELSGTDIYIGVFNGDGFVSSYFAIVAKGSDGVDCIKQKFDGIVMMQRGQKYNLADVFDVQCKSGYKFDRWYYEDENGVMTVVSDPANFAPTCSTILYAKAIEENTTDYSGFLIALIVILAIIVIAAIWYFKFRAGH